MTDILGIGSSGLTAYRKLLETIGGNITNANTDGYARRDVVLNGTGDGSMSPTSQAVSGGSGVNVDSVRRASDAFLQSQSLKATSLNSESQILADSLGQLEKSFMTTNLNPGALVGEFYNRFQDLANSPTSASSRLALIDSGTRTAEVFKTSANAVAESLNSTGTAINAGLTQINGITDQLAKLNISLDRGASGGQKANDLLDLRDKLLQQLASLTNFTTTETTSGSVTVYLGDTASGRRLVGPDGAHTLGAIETAGRLDITFDPYTNPVTTNQLTSGVVAGLLDFRREASSLLDNINRLAVGFANAVNEQHMKGVDAKGQSGKVMFSTDGLVSSASPTNMGSAKVSVAVSEAGLLAGGNYKTTYNTETKAWTVTGADGRAVTGANNLSLDGLTFSFEGQASNGDTFFLDPLKNAAASMSFLRQNPEEIATSLPIYVDPASTNTGTAQLSVDKGPVPAAITTIPSAADLYASGQSKTADFKRDGSVFFLPAGTTAVEIASLSQVSAVHFALDSTALAKLEASGDSVANSKLTLTVNLDVNTNSTQAVSLDLHPANGTLAALADAINVAAAKHDPSLRGTIFASVTNGVLNLNALGTHSVSNGALGSSDISRTPIAGTNEAGIPGADIQVFTREGRQLSGPQLSAAAAATFITAANGFLPEAKYEFVPIGNTSRYPGVDLQDTSQLLAVAQELVGNGQPATIDVTAQPEYNTTQTGLDGAITSGAVYALDLSGLPPVRLSGDAIAGKDAAGITAALMDGVNAHASTQSWLGTTINLGNSTLKDGQFNITIDLGDGPTEQTVVFYRGQGPAPTFSLLDSGTFEIAGNTGLKMSLVPGDPSGSRVMITLPPQLRTAAPHITFSADPAVTTLGLSGTLTSKVTGSGDLANALLTSRKPTLSLTGTTLGSLSISIDGSSGQSNGVAWSVIDGRLQITSDDATMQVVADDDSTALGFSGAEGAGARIGAAGDLTNALLVASPVKLNVSDVAGGTRDITINGSSGTDQNVSWAMTNGRLTLTNSGGDFHIVSTSLAARDQAVSLGFLGTDLNVTSSGTQIRVSSTVLDATAPLADSSATVSRVGSSLKFASAVPEDLIIAVANSTASGLRRIAADISTGAGSTVNSSPDINVRIDSANQLSILDPLSGRVLATRAWTGDQPVSYRGLSFTLSGKAQVGDSFAISNDTSRTGDNRNALAIAGLSIVSIFGAGQGSFQDVYDSVTSKLGAKVNSANMTAAASKTSESDLKAAYDSIAGVNLDKEAADLIRYQQAYQASAQVIMAARDMFATILKSF